MHCITWDGPTKDGLPVTYTRAGRNQGSSIYVRRLIYTGLPGNALRKWQHVDTVCDNVLCVAPDHVVATGTVEHFWLNVWFRADDECWPWLMGQSTEGYGRYVMGGRGTLNAHRIAWECVNGPIPTGLVVDHLCREKSCVNPAHMELVSPAENTRRANTKLPV